MHICCGHLIAAQIKARIGKRSYINDSGKCYFAVFHVGNIENSNPFLAVVL